MYQSDRIDEFLCRKLINENNEKFILIMSSSEFDTYFLEKHPAVDAIISGYQTYLNELHTPIVYLNSNNVAYGIPRFRDYVVKNLLEIMNEEFSSMCRILPR
jgi:hypothetical protein